MPRTIKDHSTKKRGAPTTAAARFLQARAQAKPPVDRSTRKIVNFSMSRKALAAIEVLAAHYNMAFGARNGTGHNRSAMLERLIFDEVRRERIDDQKIEDAMKAREEGA